jgi:hypothetical protein
VHFDIREDGTLVSTTINVIFVRYDRLMCSSPPVLRISESCFYTHLVISLDGKSTRHKTSTYAIKYKNRKIYLRHISIY